MTTECIDAHHHLWRYRPADFPWISDSMPALRRDCLISDLEAVTVAAGVTGTIAVQARQTLDETEWLARIAASSALIRAVVGWVPLIDVDIAAHLERCAALPKLRGVRHVLQDEDDPMYMLREDFQRGISCLAPLNLCYDLLIFERHLPQTIQFVDRNPRQVFILDHIAKPRIRQRILSPWREQLQALAQRENVYCKVSGMVTEAAWDAWREADLRDYFEVVFEAFGPNRTMFGSDWPVLNLAGDYNGWLGIVRRAVATFSDLEQQRVLAGTAIEAYGL